MPIVTVQGYSSGNHLEVTAGGKLPVEMTANVEVGAVTATDVTIHDAVTTDNKLKINADGSIPAQLAATYALVTTHHNGASANANGNTADVEGYGSASIQISGTFEGTISFEGSVDGVNYVPIRALDGAGTPVTSATAAGIFKADCAGLKYLRCPLSGYASGSVTVKSRAVLMARPTAQTVQLSGRKAQVRTINASDSTTVPAGGSTAVTVTPTAGYIARIIALAFVSWVPTGATKSNQVALVTLGSKDYSPVLRLEAPYTVSLSYSVGPGGGTVAVPADIPSQKAVLINTYFTADNPVIIYYYNYTDADQTKKREIHLTVLEEAIV